MSCVKVILCFLRSLYTLIQCFPNLPWRTPSPAYFVCLPYLTHLIQLISSLVETGRKYAGLGVLQDRFGKHCLIVSKVFCVVKLLVSSFLAPWVSWHLHYYAVTLWLYIQWHEVVFKMTIISLIAIISMAIYRTTKSCYRDRPKCAAF